MILLYSGYFLLDNEEKKKGTPRNGELFVKSNLQLPFKNRMCTYIYSWLPKLSNGTSETGTGITGKIFQKEGGGKCFITRNIINKTKILAGLIGCSFRSLPPLPPPRLGFKITSGRVGTKIDAVSIINPFPNEMPFCTVFIR